MAASVLTAQEEPLCATQPTFQRRALFAAKLLMRCRTLLARACTRPASSSWRYLSAMRHLSLDAPGSALAVAGEHDPEADLPGWRATCLPS